MSVINDMLRDLDRRHARQPPIEVGSIHVVAPTTNMNWRVPLLMVVAIAVVAGSFSVIAPRLQRNDVAAVPAPAMTTSSPATTASTPAEFVEPPPVSIQPALIERASIEPEKVATAAVVAAPMPEPAAAAMPADAPENKSASVAVTDTAQPLRKQISQSPEALAEAAYRQGALMLRQGQRSEAEREFANALALNPQHVESAVALAQGYLAAARSDAAAKLLASALADNPDALELRLLSARVLLQQGDAATALQTLRARNPELHSHSDYYAVMAALEQQQGDFRAAAEHYRALLSVDASRAAWWLGYALAQENLRAAREAIDGYRRALALNELPAAARDFAQQRLHALE